MAFSLAKGDRAVFAFFAKELSKEKTMRQMLQELEQEEKRVFHFIRCVSQQKDILWFRPWLAQSIRLRSSTIHPLSALEVISLKQRRQNPNNTINNELLRAAVAGTAIGMLTTG